MFIGGKKITMETLQVIKKRRSCRSFSSREVEQEKIDKIVEAGLHAPSGVNRQDVIIIQISDKELLKELKEVNAGILGRTGIDPFYGAPLIFIIVAEKGWFTSVEDGSLVIENMLLAAEDLSLGSIWIHRAREEMELPIGRKILEKAGLSGEYVGIGHVAIGYREQNIPPREIAIKENRFKKI